VKLTRAFDPGASSALPRDRKASESHRISNDRSGACGASVTDAKPYIPPISTTFESLESVPRVNHSKSREFAGSRATDRYQSMQKWANLSHCKPTLGYTFHSSAEPFTFFRVGGVPVIHLHAPSRKCQRRYSSLPTVTRPSVPSFKPRDAVAIIVRGCSERVSQVSTGNACFKQPTMSVEFCPPKERLPTEILPML
jgi:hypothetical protein